jgi:hypothetical protein
LALVNGSCSSGESDRADCHFRRHSRLFNGLTQLVCYANPAFGIERLLQVRASLRQSPWHARYRVRNVVQDRARLHCDGSGPCRET